MERSECCVTSAPMLCISFSICKNESSLLSSSAAGPGSLKSTGKKIAPKELFRPLRIVGLLSDRVHISRNVCESHTDYTFASDATWSAECGICAGPAYVVIPQEQKTKQKKTADQCLKKISSHGHRSQARGLTPAGTQTPSTEQR